MSIPKIIHYIWIGNNKKPYIVNKCIETWKLYFPDYEIREWNETNYDVYKNKYISEAYKEKRWAFVSDFIRFDVLYKYGGIYLDTDVEVLKRFPDEILNNINAFTGKEPNGYVSPGLVFGCEPQNIIAKKMIDSYDSSIFEASKIYTVNQRLTDLLVKEGYVIDDEFQIVLGLYIYPSDYFCGYDIDNNINKITEKTLSFHHYEASSWQKHKVKNAFKKIIKGIVGIENYKRLIQIKRKMFGISKLK